jgi:3-keto-5-aminohexanoate cleavage enzyme
VRPPLPPHPLTPYVPLAINVCLTGMVPTRERVPHVPVTPDQIASDAFRCYEAGASIAHVHARDEEGAPTWRPEVYEEIIPAIRARCPDMVICATTSGRTFTEYDQRSAVLRLEGDAKPDMASLTLGSMNFATGPSVNSPQMIESLATEMAERGIRPELEAFDSGMGYLACHLADKGVLRPPFYANIMLGSVNTAPGNAQALVHLVDSLPEGTTWAAAGLGGMQLPVNAMAVFMGGHVRVGLEDNPYFDYATRTPATNPALVSRVAALAATAGRHLATPADVREWLGLRPVEPRPYRLRPALLPSDRESILKVLATSNMHHIPSAEMHDLDAGHWYVAEVDGSVVGVAGWELQHKEGRLVGKTTLLTVLPEHRALGIGRALQDLRMGLMRDAGATSVITNADRPETIAWYERNFGYVKVGTVAKVMEFGLAEVDHWTTLEAPLE